MPLDAVRCIGAGETPISPDEVGELGTDQSFARNLFLPPGSGQLGASH